MVLAHYYRPKRSFGQGNIFTPVCHSVHRGGMARRPPPPLRLDGEPPPPRLDGEPPPPAGRRTPPAGWRPPHPPGKQTPAYGLRSAGTHPTGSILVTLMRLIGSWRMNGYIRLEESLNTKIQLLNFFL